MLVTIDDDGKRFCYSVDSYRFLLRVPKFMHLELFSFDNYMLLKYFHSCEKCMKWKDAVLLCMLWCFAKFDFFKVTQGPCLWCEY